MNPALAEVSSWESSPSRVVTRSTRVLVVRASKAGRMLVRNAELRLREANSMRGGRMKKRLRLAVFGVALVLV